jgi:transcriptional regulator with XRE-family HTH domain
VKIRIREVAASRGLTIAALARKMGIPEQMVWYWAKGVKQPRYGNMERLCKELDCTMNDLFQPENSLLENCQALNRLP